ncbi:GHKL domain-containing protein [Micrococcus porci]|uniref:sensor histidine kinase n=1 Tax=Micrococcus TaxID=1269 RepID=UPI001CCBDFB5|nr:ATP-binding protein [Micrococcus porci]MCG7421529.1 ATP-binding protein [Micrococcus sp. ACRRV]UBH23657.1 GHKL domain-containing protein [Micrococcus porci]
MRHPWSIARRVAASLVLLLSVIAVFSGWAGWRQARDATFVVEERHVLGVARLAAREEVVVDALGSPAGAAALQARIPSVVDDAGVSWLTLLDARGTRVASWRPEQVGTAYPAPVDRALAGESWTEVSATGPAGISVRALVPVRDAEGAVVGVLTMGVRVSELEVAASAQLPRLAVTFALTLAAGLGAALLVARYLHRVTLGRGPEDLAESFLLSAAAMDSLEASLVVLAPDGSIRQHNAAAVHALGLPARTEDGTVPAAARLPEELARALEEHADADFPARVGDRLFVVRQRVLGAARPRRGGAVDDAAREGISPAPAGTRVLMLHDRTDLQRLTDDLALSRTLTAALRSQTHEHANQLHTALALLDSGRTDAARDVLTRHRRPDQDAEDVVSALLEAKAAQAAERGVELTYAVRLSAPAPLAALDLVSVVGNLVDNALDAAADAAEPAGRWVDADVTCDADGLLVQVADGGPGLDPDGDRVFEPGWSTKPAGIAGRGMGLALVRSIASQAGGVVEVATDSGTVFTVEVPPAGPEQDGEAA